LGRHESGEDSEFSVHANRSLIPFRLEKGPKAEEPLNRSFALSGKRCAIVLPYSLSLEPYSVVQLLKYDPPVLLPQKSRSKNGSDWYMIDAGNFAVHILSKSARERYFTKVSDW
jgi:hypothetical protein